MKQFTLDLSQAGNMNTSLLNFRLVTAAPRQALSPTGKSALKVGLDLGKGLDPKIALMADVASLGFAPPATKVLRPARDGITWEALAKTEFLAIIQRASHRESKTTLGYIREAEAVGIDAGEPFPPLPADLILATDNGHNRPARALHPRGSPLPR